MLAALGLLLFAVKTTAIVVALLCALFGGYYTFDGDGDNDCSCDNYGHWGVSLSKDAGDFGSVSVNYEQTNEDRNSVSYDDSAKYWVGWSKEF